MFTSSSDIANSNATITCNATGFPAPNVTILKDGSLLALNGQDLIVSSTSGSLHRSISVELTNLNFLDSGVYSCNATNYLASFQRVMSQPSPYTVQCKHTQNSPLSFTVTILQILLMLLWRQSPSQWMSLTLCRLCVSRLVFQLLSCSGTILALLMWAQQHCNNSKEWWTLVAAVALTSLDF